MLTGKRGGIQIKIPTTSSQSILGFVTCKKPTAKTLVSKILADLISKVIDESEKSVAKEQLKAEELSYEWKMRICKSQCRVQ